MVWRFLPASSAGAASVSARTGAASSSAALNIMAGQSDGFAAHAFLEITDAFCRFVIDAPKVEVMYASVFQNLRRAPQQEIMRGRRLAFLRAPARLVGRGPAVAEQEDRRQRLAAPQCPAEQHAPGSGKTPRQRPQDANRRP